MILGGETKDIYDRGCEASWWTESGVLPETERCGVNLGYL